MVSAAHSITFIGFGEAGMAFATGLRGARAYDCKTDMAATRAAKLSDYTQMDVDGAISNAAAVTGAQCIMSLVTADRALEAALETARGIAPGTLYCDMNSVSPDTKCIAAQAIAAAGGLYADVAVMAPVHPAGQGVPLRVSGEHAGATAEALGAAGFTNVRIVGTKIGDASSIKMIRSVMVKGIEALSVECVLAADQAGVLDDVIASLDASWPGADWGERFDYNLGRMMEHGLRRAAEMEEVVKTLDALRTGSAMTRGTVERQRAIGALGLTPPTTFSAKLDALLKRSKDQAA